MELPADDDAAPQEIEELEHALPGVSIRTGLARMGGNRVLYRRLLRIFAERHGDIAATLRALHQAGNLDQLYMEAHNLKGEAGNLGFDSVKLAADLLGQQIRFGEGERVPELTAILATQCETMLATLRKLPGCAGERASSDANSTESLRDLALDRVLPLLNQLVPQLKSRNLAARHLAGEISELTRGTELAEEFALIMQGVQQLRYDAALASLGQLLDRHQWRQP
jgi:HPt (histidine-containing phosphotransfer) domain-containing protein